MKIREREIDNERREGKEEAIKERKGRKKEIMEIKRN